MRFNGKQIQLYVRDCKTWWPVRQPPWELLPHAAQQLVHALGSAQLAELDQGKLSATCAFPSTKKISARLQRISGNIYIHPTEALPKKLPASVPTLHLRSTDTGEEP